MPRPGLQFWLQFTAVQRGPGTTGAGRWSSLNGSEQSRPELLMRLGFRQLPIRIYSQVQVTKKRDFRAGMG